MIKASKVYSFIITVGIIWAMLLLKDGILNQIEHNMEVKQQNSAQIQKIIDSSLAPVYITIHDTKGEMISRDEMLKRDAIILTNKIRKGGYTISVDNGPIINYPASMIGRIDIHPTQKEQMRDEINITPTDNNDE